jgi:hypothetical protein
MIVNTPRESAELIAQRVSDLNLPFMTLITCDNVDVSTLTDQQLKDAGLMTQKENIGQIIRYLNHLVKTERYDEALSY